MERYYVYVEPVQSVFLYEGRSKLMADDALYTARSVMAAARGTGTLHFCTANRKGIDRYVDGRVVSVDRTDRFNLSAPYRYGNGGI